MKQVKARASGKVILIGEHFVVPTEEGGTTGVPAIAFPLEDLWCEVRLSATDYPRYRADLPDAVARDVIENLMARATYAAADSLRIDITAQPFAVESISNFQVSRGFGSSAAFAVALARAFGEYRRQIAGSSADWNELLKAVGSVEKIFHGRPSGLDVAVIMSGRPIRFENGEILREIANNAVDFVAIDGGNRDNCASLIEQVSVFRKKKPEQWQRMSAVVRELVDTCESALANGRSIEIAKAMRESHAILAELNLSSPMIDDIISDGVRHGALAGKVSGAGGGGAVLLATNKGDAKRVSQKMREAGYSVVAQISSDKESFRGGPRV
jgi:mevalonate kinase